MNRFIRDFELIIGLESSAQAVIVRPPFRVSFSGDKSIGGALNKLNLKVYNLKESTRLQIQKLEADSTYIPIQFSVGYRGALEPLFKGNVYKAEVIREGADFYNQVECLDGGFDFLNSFTSRTVTKKDEAIVEILQDMPNTNAGKITQQPSLVRPKVLVGNSVQLINDMLNEGESWFIEDEQLYILKDDEVIRSFIPVVNAQTGLLNTPIADPESITFETLMNPSLKIGGLCELQSKTAPFLNGVYKTEVITYTGDSDGDDWLQQITARKEPNVRVL